MADNTVKVNINVSDNKTVEKLIKNVERLNRELTKSQKLARGIAEGMPQTTAAAAAGMRRSSAQSAATKGRYSAQAGELEDYGRGRAAIGTGAAGRDFAQQAQGLGGLVRVYATYAANLFAVSAAFSALRNAADTTNLVKGLQQLSAASGQNLPKIAKDLESVSGGAISFREAMTSTVQASSAGMSGENIRRLGSVALKASQALGVSMPDALNRLTRGITKLEPELLDELGIFTKIDPAVDEYARSIGKSAGSLTDFERSQAFANAALTEGEKKFGEVATQVNAYDKLLATLKNVAQQGLEVVNVALLPIVDLLSKSPTALMVALGLIGTTLLKQAIPAVTQWRQQIHESAEASANFARQNKEFYDNFKKNNGPMNIQGVLLGQIAKNADLAEKKYTILANAADDASFAGPTVALRRLWSDVSKLTKLDGTAVNVFGKGLLFLRGAATVAAAGISTLAAAAGNLLGIIGLLIAGFTLVTDWLSKNKEESERASASIDNLKSSGDNFLNTMKRAEGLNPLEKLKPENIAATTNSMEDLATSMKKAFIDTQEAIKKRGTVDEISETIKGWLSISQEDKLQEQLTSQITKILDASATSPQVAAAKRELAKAFGLGEFASDLEIKTAFLKDPEKAIQYLEKISRKANVFGQSTVVLKGNIDELGKTFQDMTNELMPSGKLVSAVLQSAAVIDDLAKIIEGPMNDATIAAMLTFAKSGAAMAMVSEENREKVQSLIPALTQMGTELQKTGTASEVTQAQIKNLQDTFQHFGDIQIAPLKIQVDSRKITEDVNTALKLVKAPSLLGPTLEKVASPANRAEQERAIRETFRAAIASAYEKNQALITTIHKNALREIQIKTQQDALAQVSVTADVIRRQAELQKEQAKARYSEQVAQADLVQAMTLANLGTENLSVSMDKLTLAIEENTLSRVGGTAADRERVAKQRERLYAPDKETGKSLSDRMAERNTLRSDLLKQPTLLSTLSIEQLVARGLSSAEAAKLKLQYGEMQRARSEYNTTLAKIDRDALAGMQKLAFETTSKALTKEAEDLARRIKGLEGGITPEENREREALQTRLEEVQTQLAKLPFEQQKALNKIYAPATGLTPEQQAGLQAVPGAEIEAVGVGRAADAAQAARERAAKDAVEQLKQQEERRVQLSKLDSLALDQRQQVLDTDKETLAINKELGNISDQEYKNRSRALELAQDELTYERNIANIREEMLANRAAKQQEITSFEKLELDQSAKAVRDSLAVDEQVYARKLQLENQRYEQLQRTRRLETSMNDRQLAYADQFKQAFTGMAGAMIEWAKTGKWSAKEVFNSLVEGIVRYEMQLRALEMYAMARPFIMSFISSLFGPTGMFASGRGSGMGASPDGFPTISPGQTVQAKGGAWNNGIMEFAKGGAFTNSIVSNPTLFKFAKGTGLMGEAGPEAIMPLKRDSNGNLGVRSNQQKTEVVVNNYSGQPAQAKETTDARGNRRIEVVVGDMTAGELTRNGSSTNRAIRGTFGLQPQLIRR